jgi:hypothetical protein
VIGNGLRKGFYGKAEMNYDISGLKTFIFIIDSLDK